MDYRDYENLHRGRKGHFYFEAKKGLLGRLLGRYLESGGDRDIIDLGAGVGLHLPVLARYGRVTAFDRDPRAVRHIAARGYKAVAGDINTYDWPSEKFDAATAFDLLEHIEDDRRALANIHRLLKKNGFFFFTVPAGPALFGPHDIALAHCRRYRKKGIEAEIKAAGFNLLASGYWNSLFFPPAAIYRWLRKIFSGSNHRRPPKPDSALPLPFINRLYLAALLMENRLVGKNVSLPFGLTIFGVAQK